MTLLDITNDFYNLVKDIDELRNLISENDEYDDIDIIRYMEKDLNIQRKKINIETELNKQYILFSKMDELVVKYNAIRNFYINTFLPNNDNDEENNNVNMTSNFISHNEEDIDEEKDNDESIFLTKEEIEKYNTAESSPDINEEDFKNIYGNNIK